jgi:hypothetical protein
LRQVDAARPIGAEIVADVSDQLPIRRVIGGFEAHDARRDVGRVLLRIS